MVPLRVPARVPFRCSIRNLLGGSWDLVARVIIKVTILIITYNPT